MTNRKSYKAFLLHHYKRESNAFPACDIKDPITLSSKARNITFKTAS